MIEDRRRRRASPERVIDGENSVGTLKSHRKPAFSLEIPAPRLSRAKLVAGPLQPRHKKSHGSFQKVRVALFFVGPAAAITVGISTFAAHQRASSRGLVTSASP